MIWLKIMCSIDLQAIHVRETGLQLAGLVLSLFLKKNSCEIGLLPVLRYLASVE